MKTDEKLVVLRQMMTSQQIAALIVPSADPHQSEYVTGHWQARAWLTGFTGSAGVAVVTRTHALLWTDFRYWLQAGSQIRGSEFELVKSGEPGVLEFHDWILRNLSPKDTVAVDGRVISRNQEKKYRKLWNTRQILFRTDLDFVEKAWQDRPPMPVTKTWDFPVRFAGQSRSDKIAKIREAMAESGADHHVMTGLEDIAWALNLRGSDAPGNPVNIAFVLVDMDQVRLFIHPDKVDQDLAAVLGKDNIQLSGYHDIFDTLKKLPDQAGVLLDPDMVSAGLFAAINPDCRIIEAMNPAARFKTRKNNTQIGHLRNTAVKDGVAVVQFLHWLDTQEFEDRVTEISAAHKLFELRKNQKDFVENSFNPIMACGEHSAMCHYSAAKDTDARLQNTGMFLTDSGGNYLTGTTDITRTICLGSPTPQQITDYTLVLKGHIAVATACFPEGTRGFQIDTLARQFLWRQGMNFGHGTGHGVGFFLCVHEGPARISPHPVDVALEKGMLMTNEPGLYREGEYGIRLENMVLVTDACQTQFGRFLGFENLTWCHFERELVDISLLTGAEIAWINQYHGQVFESLSPYLEPSVRSWLESRTRPL
ncbi:MAG: aminopeptidase P family protein [Desulfotignum sp.]|nr:aminopeptidase P family protein [Desulfotignum sp.]MCF8124975.1 aminopeptidase P family protein [Desulfotignum sp.]